MSGIADHGAFLRKRIQRVPGYEPCRLDIVFLEELQEPPDTDRACKETWNISVRFVYLIGASLNENGMLTSGNVAGRVLSAI